MLESENNPTPNGDEAAQRDAELRERREQEQRMSEVNRKIHEAKRAQDEAVEAGEPMRHADHREDRQQGPGQLPA